MRESLQVEELRTAERMEDMPVQSPVQSQVQSSTQTPIQNAAQEESTGPLLPQDSVQDFRARWDHVQAAFVDEPRAAVKQADDLVNTAIQRLSESFTAARNNLEQQWDRGDEVNTENLRVAFRKYRAFFQRIMAV